MSRVSAPGLVVAITPCLQLLAGNQQLKPPSSWTPARWAGRRAPVLPSSGAWHALRPSELRVLSCIVELTPSLPCRVAVSTAGPQEVPSKRSVKLHGASSRVTGQCAASERQPGRPFELAQACRHRTAKPSPAPHRGCWAPSSTKSAPTACRGVRRRGDRAPWGQALWHSHREPLWTEDCPCWLPTPTPHPRPAVPVEAVTCTAGLSLITRAGCKSRMPHCPQAQCLSLWPATQQTGLPSNARASRGSLFAPAWGTKEPLSLWILRAGAA